MIRISNDDVLRGLKKFKRLAKQDLLASGLTDNPKFWSSLAEARRSQYTELMSIVEDDGVEGAYRHAIGRYASLPRFVSTNICGSQPILAGRKLALEMFFTMIGVTHQAALQAAAVNKVGALRAQSQTPAISGAFA